jgi:hypothetical protein
MCCVLSGTAESTNWGPPDGNAAKTQREQCTSALESQFGLAEEVGFETAGQAHFTGRQEILH